MWTHTQHSTQPQSSLELAALWKKLRRVWTHSTENTTSEFTIGEAVCLHATTHLSFKFFAVQIKVISTYVTFVFPDLFTVTVTFSTEHELETNVKVDGTFVHPHCVVSTETLSTYVTRTETLSTYVTVTETVVSLGLSKMSIGSAVQPLWS